MSHRWLQMTLLAWAIFWWRETTFLCKPDQPCPPFEQATAVREPGLWLHEGRCQAEAQQLEAAMQAAGWSFRRFRIWEGKAVHLSVHYRYACKPVPPIERGGS